MAWAKNVTNTLSSAAEPLTILGLTGFNFNFLMSHTLDGGSTSAPRISIQDAGTGTNHAGRTSLNGAADATQTSRGDWVSNASENASNQFEICYFLNIESEEKLGMYNCCDESVTGAGTAPQRREGIGKYADGGSEVQITRIDIVTSTSNNFAIDSNLSALGTD